MFITLTTGRRPVEVFLGGHYQAAGCRPPGPETLLSAGFRTDEGCSKSGANYFPSCSSHSVDHKGDLKTFDVPKIMFHELA